ncbi:glutathione synthase/RimK-type ligase-like ATP-grasp enzyme [Oikeobacillus pervagus]|uniref:Glutathione synthase/RimK-type ligase-like ATP-grasp enzyme n=1 Tax=Oikeobacillus pervagus TaxID=1325931 RepID=A0AAJ1WJT2_9BACI|nr:YheC/YheD family protein [Oikeobacillus pervagus]MDQ0215848.1 glutathione synthase/RimK-type ligase-like ATP-grasp enzyme [Oikeobacillus pervagus]
MHCLGKWNQYEILKRQPLLLKHLPETTLYSQENLINFLYRHYFIYVKHDTSGQGRGIFKVSKRDDSHFHITGYSLYGKVVDKIVETTEEFHQILHPFIQFGRLSGQYIIQEGIESITKDKLPFSLRVHIQYLDGNWIIGGIYGKISTTSTIKNGIVNSHQGAQIITIDKLLSLHPAINHIQKDEILDSLGKTAKLVAKEVAMHSPCREYGMDFGIDTSGKPIFFEVNTTPGIKGFAKIENKSLWKRIVNIRKKQNEDSSRRT